MSRIYDKPAIPARQVRAVQIKNTLEADTDVVVLFRGGPAIVDMYDQKDYIIPPKPPEVSIAEWRAGLHPAEHFEMPYGVAEHLKGRAIVPGTRNPYDYKKTVSQLAIPSIDPADRCVPFTEEQLEKHFGAAYQAGLAEGIDRKAMVGPERNAVVVDVAETVAALAGEGRDIEGEIERAASQQTLTPADASEALRDVAAGERAAEASGARVSHTRRGKVNFTER